jgi:pimeloyl-ACP methyl ester carboxylesterase
LRGLVFSRYGYGRSTARPLDRPLTSDFMHFEATAVLPRLFAQLGINRPWLFGHSDGASIALLHAAHHGAYMDGTLRARLAQYHADVCYRILRSIPSSCSSAANPNTDTSAVHHKCHFQNTTKKPLIIRLR